MENLTACSLPYAITVAQRCTHDYLAVYASLALLFFGLKVTGLFSAYWKPFFGLDFCAKPSRHIGGRRLRKFLQHIKGLEAHTGFEPVQSDWKSEVLPLHKYAAEDHLKLSVHNNGEKERIQTLDGGQF